MTENSKILIDCGITNKKLVEGLASLDISPKDINAVLITHEHSDHIQGLKSLCKNAKVDVYANHHTMDAINQPIDDGLKKYFVTNEKFELNDLKITPFAIPHDAADPVGFSIEKGDKKISVATDIGHMNTNIMENLIGSNFVLLEANYEPEMLMASRYPYILKRRILGPYGHLSNDEAGDALVELYKNGVTNIQLGHLSQQNNFPELAYKTVLEKFINNNIDTSTLNISVASRDHVDKIIDIE
jgi:phosphoribosyl 1,2-cyclic phosphodiesterase